METREFGKRDWDGFQGAEGWVSATMDSPPLISTGKFENGKEYVVVLDASGGCLMVEDDDEVNACGGYQLLLAFPTQATAKAFALGMGNPKHADEFLRLGFEAN